jgi:hypothetical protein
MGISGKALRGRREAQGLGRPIPGPADSRDRVIELANRSEKMGLGFLVTGGPGSRNSDQRPNPAAILEETAIKVHSRALAGLAAYETLFPHREIDESIRSLE